MGGVRSRWFVPLVALLAAGGLFWALALGRGGSSGADAVRKTSRVRPAVRSGRDAKSVRPPVRFRPAPDPKRFRDARDALAKLRTRRAEGETDGIQDALDAGDLAFVRESAAAVLREGGRDEKLRVVDALDWFGSEALEDLARFVEDPDEDVRREAAAAWQRALFGLEDERAKAAAIERALVCFKDESLLAEIAREFNGMDESVAKRTLRRVMDRSVNQTGLAVARETYRSLFGE